MSHFGVLGRVILPILGYRGVVLGYRGGGVPIIRIPQYTTTESARLKNTAGEHIKAPVVFFYICWTGDDGHAAMVFFNPSAQAAVVFLNYAFQDNMHHDPQYRTYCSFAPIFRVLNFV